MNKTILIKERPDLKTSEVLALCKESFPVSSYYDDARLNKDFPVPKEATERTFLNSQEPDNATLGLSVREAEAKGNTQGITIRERMLLELAYFAETGQHMDVKGITFCNGSRHSDGFVPCAFWDDDEFRVGWDGLGNSDSDCGIRSAVSLDPSFPLTLGLDEFIQIVKKTGFVVYKPM